MRIVVTGIIGGLVMCLCSATAHPAPQAKGGSQTPAPTTATTGDSLRTGSGRDAPSIPNPPFVATQKGVFNQPWAMTFLPDGRLLVTLKAGQLKLLNVDTGVLGDVTGVPAVVFGGQGGLGDVVLHPQFASNGLVYISYAEVGPSSTRGAAVARATLTFAGNGGSLSGLTVVWRQTPKVTGEGHYGHRIAFGGDGKLFISSGDRQKFDPAQDMQATLGKIIRLNDDGTVPADNPFAGQPGVTAQIWTLGHRNPLGLALDMRGRLWEHEMGPEGGDELNLIERGTNYGWPLETITSRVPSSTRRKPGGPRSSHRPVSSSIPARYSPPSRATASSVGSPRRR